MVCFLSCYAHMHVASYIVTYIQIIQYLRQHLASFNNLIFIRLRIFYVNITQHSTHSYRPYSGSVAACGQTSKQQQTWLMLQFYIQYFSCI